MTRAAEIDYRLRGRAHGVRAGAHPGRASGDGQQFFDLAPFLSKPDARHLDLRHSLNDPLGALWVRRQQQLLTIPVWLIADLSASMDYAGVHSKMDTLADFIVALAQSVCRVGDRFGFLGCDEVPRLEWRLPPTRQPTAALRLAVRLRQFHPQGSHARGLLRAARLLSSRRALVFLVSDFHLPLPVIRELMLTLHRHEVVPVVLWDPAESGRVARGNGPARFTDLETGHERALWLRADLRERLLNAFNERRQRLRETLRSQGRNPLFLEGSFDAAAVNHYFRGVR